MVVDDQCVNVWYGSARTVQTCQHVDMTTQHDEPLLKNTRNLVTHGSNVGGCVIGLLKIFRFTTCLIAFRFSGRFAAMAGYAESNASFRHRAKAIQLTDDHLRALHDSDIKCFNHMAFAVNGQPGQLDQGRFQEMVDIVCPRGASMGVQAALKQLAYESLTVAVAAIKQRVETPDETSKRLPPQEKDQRLRDLKDKINGFVIAGDYEPAHCVIDAFASMVEEGVMKFFPLSKCVSREHELQSVRSDKQIVLLEGQQLQVKPKGAELQSDLGNELKVHHAFIRRGLALEMANMATYQMHEKVMREFMSHLTRATPGGFKGPTIESVLRADKELWTRVADEVRSNLRPDANAELPVDKALEKHYMSASVLFHLLPLPLQTGSQTKRKADADDVPQGKPDAKPGTGNGAPGGNKNRRGKKARQGRTNLPAGLHGYSGWNKQRQRICYNFNMAHGCSNQVTKDGNHEKCSRGMHQCIKCHGKHALQNCNN